MWLTLGETGKEKDKKKKTKKKRENMGEMLEITCPELSLKDERPFRILQFF